MYLQDGKLLRDINEVNEDFKYLKTIKNDSKIKYKRFYQKVALKDLKMHYTEAKLVKC